MYFQIFCAIFALGTLCEGATYQNLALELHNKIRANHSTKPLRLDPYLSHRAVQCAAEYAETANAQGKVPKLFCGERYKKGENSGSRIASRTANFTIEISMLTWHNEEALFFYDNPEFFDETREYTNKHFIQVVWKPTTTFGCGVQTRRNRTFVVCLYDPPGGNETTSQIDLQNNVGRPIRGYQANALEQHNQLRERHFSQKMTPDNELNKIAVLCAHEYAEAENLYIDCGALSKLTYFVGLNVHQQTKSESLGIVMKKAITSWYNSESNYDYKRPGYQPLAATFTQVVWNASNKLGCGVDITGSYAVCLYAPLGNIHSKTEFEKNVKEAKKL